MGKKKNERLDGPDPLEGLPERRLLYVSEVAALVAVQKGITPRGAANVIYRRIERGYYVGVSCAGTIMLPRSEAIRILRGDEIE